MNANRCPVCGMDAENSDLTAAHIGVAYRFCSRQCLENFNAHPRLYVGKGAQKAEGKSLMKRRTFALERPVANTEALREALLGMMGVKAVEVSDTRLVVSYDLFEVTATQIEAAIEQTGAALANGWMQRMRRGWVQYTEDNELENLSRGDAPCCNRPPHA